MTQKVRGVVILGVAVLLLASPAFAGLKIRLKFDGTKPPPTSDLVKGGGDLRKIMEVAARSWERVFPIGGGMWILDLTYGWESYEPNHDGGPYGFVREDTYGGNNPTRIVSARVTFNNTVAPEPGWFADPTPDDATEYRAFASLLWDEQGYFVNRSRLFTEATGDAAGRIDLLSVAIHEIGHALGLARDYPNFRSRCANPNFCLLEITAPRPYAGLVVNLGMGPHIETGQGDLLDVGAVMVSEPVPGERRLISNLDALVLAEISSFKWPNLDPMLPEPW